MMFDARRALLWGAVALVGVVMPFLYPAYMTQMSELWLFIVFALTWDLVGGQMGYNSFGNVVFIGVGMYTCAVVQIGLFYSVAAYTAARGGGTAFVFPEAHYLWGLGLGLPVGGVVAALVAAGLGSLVLGMRGHYFAICTLGLGIAAAQLAAGWEWIGAGSGLTAPPPPEDMGDTSWLFYFLSFGLAAVTFVVLALIYRTRFALAINAIRDSEDKAEAMGLRTTQIKVTAWVISAVFLGVAGGIYGNLKRFIDPAETAFAGATIGVWMVLMAILGGKGSLWGPVVGAVIFQITKEFFWTYFLGWQRVALGVLIVLIVVFFPQGILGWFKERFPERFGHKVEPAMAQGETGEAAE